MNWRLVNIEIINITSYQYRLDPVDELFLAGIIIISSIMIIKFLQLEETSRASFYSHFAIIFNFFI